MYGHALRVGNAINHHHHIVPQYVPAAGIAVALLLSGILVYTPQSVLCGIPAGIPAAGIPAGIFTNYSAGILTCCLHAGIPGIPTPAAGCWYTSRYTCCWYTRYTSASAGIPD